VLALVAALFIRGGAVSAAGNVRITNLDDAPVKIARVYYDPGHGSSELLAPEPPHWVWTGWDTLNPGETRYFSSGYFYVKDSEGNRLRWRNRPEKVTYLDQNEDFSLLYYPGTKTWHYDRERAGNFTKATFQKLEGRYYISGSAYEFREKTFRFDFRSRDSQYFNQCYTVPGQVVNHEVNASQKHGPSPRWSTPQSNKVCLMVHVQGKAPYPTAAREQGYYVGSVTITYTARR
jgi:hypothetical protein